MLANQLTLDDYNRAFNVHVVLRRNADLERMIILNRPVQINRNQRSRRLSLQADNSTEHNQPIIRQQNITESPARPIPKRRTSLSIPRPSLDAFFDEINKTAEQSATNEQIQRRSSFFSRGRRLSTSSSSSLAEPAELLVQEPFDMDHIDHMDGVESAVGAIGLDHECSNRIEQNPQVRKHFCIYPGCGYICSTIYFFF